MNIPIPREATPSPEPKEWHTIKLIESPLYRYGLMIGAVVYVLFALNTIEIDWTRFINGIPRGADIIVRMFPPDFSRWELLLKGMLESVQIAFAASFFGMILAVPLGLCAASNLVPRPVYMVARTIIILTRSFHEIIIAIFFVKIFGFGPLAGVLTLIVASMNFIAKMLAEDIENLPAGQLEAIRATGASIPKLLIYCFKPQALPRYLGGSIYRLDANIRHSTVVGIVGAGGIGQVLAATFTRYDYDFSLAIILAIVFLVFLGEFFSNWVRGRLR